MVLEKSRIACLLVIAAFANSLSFPAIADPAENVKQTDLNRDNAIDRGEYQRRMTDRFFLLDDDWDGKLSLTEIAAAGSDAFSEADTDGDSGLSLREYLNSRFLDFDAADTDGNGVLSPGEVRLWPGN